MRPIKSLFKQDSKYLYHIEGIRALAGLTIILFHFSQMVQVLLTDSQYFELIDHSIFGVAIASTVSLDTFFLISGLVIGYTVMREKQKFGQISAKNFYIKRIARLYPSYLLLMFVCLPLNFPFACYIWSNILEVNNQLTAIKQYLPWAWSLAVEFHFYTVVAFFIICDNRFKMKKILPYLVGVALFIPIIYSLWVSAHNGWYMTFDFYINRGGWFFDALFDKTGSRMGPFVHGLVVAYLLVYQKERVINWIDNRSAWTISLMMLAFIFLAVSMVALDPFWPLLHHHLHTWQSTGVWAITLRNIFSMCIAGLILLCEKPKGLVWLLQKFLGLPIWRPFSQLAFNVFLFHPTIIMFYMGWFIMTEQHIFIGDITNILLVSYVFSYLLAAIVYCWVELPANDYLRRRFAGNPT